MTALFAIVVFVLAMSVIDVSLENIYKALDRIADELKELRK